MPRDAGLAAGARDEKGRAQRPFFSPSRPRAAPARRIASMFFREPPKPVLTPCVGICTLDASGLCEGCLRTIDEITGWRAYTDAERARIMRDVLPAREAARSP